MSADVKELAVEYLQKGRMMQLATMNEGQPWICTVYFVPDESQQHLYWISVPTARHSQELEANGRVAAAVPIKYLPHSNGERAALQIEGDAARVKDIDETKRAIQLYMGRYRKGQTFMDDFLAGKLPMKLYKLTPRSIKVFDPQHFPDTMYQEFTVND